VKETFSKPSGYESKKGLHHNLFLCYKSLYYRDLYTSLFPLNNQKVYKFCYNKQKINPKEFTTSIRISLYLRFKYVKIVLRNYGYGQNLSAITKYVNIKFNCASSAAFLINIVFQ